MYTGTKKESSGNYSPKTGLSTFQFIGINLSKEKIEALTGRELSVEPNYNLQQDLNQHSVRPIHVYYKHNELGLVKSIFQIGSDAHIAQSGNYQVVTTSGSVVWAKKDGQVKPEFADHLPLKIGEADLITLISKIINFDTTSGQNIYQQMTNLKQDAKSLFEGIYSGFDLLAKWVEDNNKFITLPLTVKQVKTEQEDGTILVQNKQRVSPDPSLYFHGEFTQWMAESLKKRYEKSLVVGPGQTKAYPLIKDYFTYEYQDFQLESCVNYVPELPTQGW